MRRSASAKEQSPAFVADSGHLDALFGSTQPARGKHVEGGIHRTPIQTQEIETLTDGHTRVKINPTRLFVSTAPALELPRRHDPAKLSKDLGLSEDAIDRIRSTPTFHEQTASGAPPAAPLAQRLRLGDLRDKKVEYKWNIASNGSLVIGEAHPGVALDEPMTNKSARKKKQPYTQGHVTLVGGQPWKTPWQENRLMPQARLSGTLYYNPDSKLCIDNDSGRFSEYADRMPKHLENVANLFQSYGLPVTPEWKEKKQIPLQNLPAGAAAASPSPEKGAAGTHSGLDRT
ncbi:type III secretion system effector protein [Xanthomonas bromi]|uniref:Type III secretion system effector protein n=1 Tax=Xanthomonas bromi TaxID=56449 RepID=A0ABX5BMJ3_9XANT|nr:type III secretion system effector protein [Xanthomonas bromi]